MESTDKLYSAYISKHYGEINSICNSVAFKYGVDLHNLRSDTYFKLLKAIRNNQYDPSCGTFMAFTSTLIRRTAIDMWRMSNVKRQRDSRLPPPITESSPRYSSSYQNLTNRITDYISVIESKSKIASANYTIVYNNFFLQDKTYNEIAQEHNIPLGTVKVTVMRLKEKINNKFRKEFINIL